jgi:hypothetical protein
MVKVIKSVKKPKTPDSLVTNSMRRELKKWRYLGEVYTLKPEIVDLIINGIKTEYRLGMQIRAEQDAEKKQALIKQQIELNEKLSKIKEKISAFINHIRSGDF